jgi:gluconolactonase
VTDRFKPIPLSQLEIVVSGLARSEDVVAGDDGRLYVSNSQSACAVVERDGSIRHVGKPMMPNGIAMDAQGRIVIANMGLVNGGPGHLQRLDPRTGEIETLASHIDGRELVASNFPLVAPDGSVYCSHTTWGPEVGKVMDPSVHDGFVYRWDPDGSVHMVCDGLYAANGLCFDLSGKVLLVAQTAAADVVGIEIYRDGSYGSPKPYTPPLGSVPPLPSMSKVFDGMSAAERSGLGHPDGVGVTQDGAIWVTLPFANRVVAIMGGTVSVVIDDPGREIIDMPTNISWGGPDLTDLYVASLRNGRIVKTKSPVPGVPLAHQRR